MASSPASSTLPGAVAVRQPRRGLRARVVAWRAMRRRAALAAGLTRAATAPAARAGLGAAVAVDAAAVALARAELEAVAVLLRELPAQDPAAVRVIAGLLCDPSSALYHPRWPGELRDQLMGVLAALGPAASSLTTRIAR